MEEILKANSEWHKSEVKKGKVSLFEPNLGEAFSRAVQTRMLGGGRAALIQSFGTEPQTVVEHALAASRIRKERDTRLTVVTVLFGLLFLPGALLWIGVFQLRRTLAGSKDKRAGAIGGALLLGVAALAVVFLVALPFTGFLGWYLRGVIIAPVIGWLLAKRICETTAKDLRARWSDLLAGGGLGAKVPEAVPGHPDETAREELRSGLEKLTAEQRSNAVFYAGPKGILGMGTRWGNWTLAEELVPKEAGKEIHQFRSYDVIRAMHDQLKMLERGPLNSGGFPKPEVKHWIVRPVDENAGSVSRPEGQDVEAYQVKPHEIQRICNHQQFGAGDRHYLGVQFVLWDGQLIITMMITVTVLHETLRIEVTGHALGPVNPSSSRSRRRRRSPSPRRSGSGRPRRTVCRWWSRRRPCGSRSAPPSPGIRRSSTSSVGSCPCRSPSACGTPGRTSPGGTASWPTTRCARPRRCCGWRTRRPCGC